MLQYLAAGGHIAASALVTLRNPIRVKLCSSDMEFVHLRLVRWVLPRLALFGAGFEQRFGLGQARQTLLAQRNLIRDDQAVRQATLVGVRLQRKQGFHFCARTLERPTPNMFFIDNTNPSSIILVSRCIPARLNEERMSLTDQLRNDLKDAMRAKDQPRMTTIRMLLSALKYEETAKRQRALDGMVQARGMALQEIPETELPPVEPLTDAEMQQVVAREVKKRQDSIEAYRKAGREDLASSEEAEVVVLRNYLPAQMGRDEARARVGEIIAEIRGDGPALRPADMKRVMPVVMERLRDRADGRTLNQLVRELLSS